MKKITLFKMAFIALFLTVSMVLSAQTYCTQDITYPNASGVRVFKSVTTTGFVTNYTNLFINDGSKMPAKKYNQVVSNGSNLLLEAHPGDNVELNFTIQMGWTDLIMFIDYNCDKDFTDAGEQVQYFLGNNSASPQSNFIFTIPSDATLGTTRIRVKSGWLRSSNAGTSLGTLTTNPELNPCYMDGSAGMLVDINLKISEKTAVAINNIGEDLIKIISGNKKLTVFAPDNSTCYVYTAAGALIANEQIQNSKDFELQQGLYILKITNQYGSFTRKTIVRN